MKRTLSYPAADISDSTKTFLASLFVVLEAEGKTMGEFVKNCSDAGLAFSKSSLSAWVARIKRGHSAISPTKLTGGSAALERGERDVLAGWVLHQNSFGKSVHISNVIEFVDKQFDVRLSTGTVSAYLSEDGFTYRVVKKKSSSFVVDLSVMRTDLWKWVQSVNFDIPHDKIVSIDFTFTGHRTERQSSFAPAGGAQPMQSESISTYTNCIVTAVWADGINRTPPMLFTYNNKFSLDHKETPAKVEQMKYLRECARRNKIDVKRLVVIGKLINEKEHYARECPDLLRRFWAHYGVPDETLILSDNGKSFFEQGESVLTNLGFNEHRCYAANVHQIISPNDNPLHGTSKQSWRTSDIDHSDDVASCLRLLHYLDRDITKHSKHWFARNMLELTESGVAALIGSNPGKKSDLHKAWLRSYRIHMGEDARRPQDILTDNLNDGLDGVYWEK